MLTILQDIRYAIRMLLKYPLFSLVAIFTLALGIGANTSIFSVVNTVLLRPLPYPEPGQLVQILKKNRPDNQFRVMGEESVSGHEYLAWKEHNHTCSQIAAYSGNEVLLTGLGPAERIPCGKVTSTFFPLLGIQPVLGRNFLDEEDRGDGPNVVILSSRFWQNRLGGDSEAIGKIINLYEKPYTVIGVLPSTFRFSEPFEIYLPLRLNPVREGIGNARISITLVHALARLKPKIPVEKASEELNAIVLQIRSQYSAPDIASINIPDFFDERGADTPDVKPSNSHTIVTKHIESTLLPSNDTDRIVIASKELEPVTQSVDLPYPLQEHRKISDVATKGGPNSIASEPVPLSLQDSVGSSDRKTIYVKGTGALLGLEGSEVKLVGLHEYLTENVRIALLVMFGAVGFVLLIACANVANLLLARAIHRQKEIAIRSALGASRMRVIRMLLVESVLLAVCGGGLGLVVAFWGVDLLRGLGSLQIKYMSDIAIDRQVFGFTFLLAVLTGIFFGFVPAMQTSKLDLNRTLKESNRESQAGHQRHLFRNSLVVSEVALSLVLLIGAGLLMKSFYRVMNVDLGFQMDRVLSAQIHLERMRYNQNAEKLSFSLQCLQRLQALPGVQYAAIGSSVPLMNNYSQMMVGLQIEGRPRNDEDLTPVSIISVSPDYFRALSISLRNGRYFSEQDAPSAPDVAIVNEVFIRRYIPEGNPLGRRILLPAGDGQRSIAIVGIVGNVRQTGLESDILPVVYRPYVQNPEPMISLAILTDGNPLNLANDLRSIVASIDPNQPVQNIMTMERRLSDSVAPRRLNMLLLGAFAALALLLACIGIFGVMSYSVIQRTHEIGVRMALGAQRGAILRLVVGQGMALAAIGIAIGLLASFLLTQYLASMLYSVNTADVITYIGVSIFLFLVALLACYLPARRAAKVDPMTALRCE